MTRLSYDAVGDAFAIVLRDLPSVETLEIAKGVLLDLGEDGDPVGLEFLSLAHVAPFMAAHGGRYELPTRSNSTTKPRGTA
jgi:uncharacterized protein YuzE